MIGRRPALWWALAASLPRVGLAQPASAPPSVPVAASAPASASAALLGTYRGAGCTGRDRLPAHEAWLGRPVDLVLDSPAQDSWQAMGDTLRWLARCWQPVGRRLVLALPMLPRDGTSTLAAGASGAYDLHFQRFAQTLVQHGQANAIVRIGFEFNARWFPWSSLDDPASWKAYWRRIVGVMRAVPGAQFQFDWSTVVHAAAPSPEPAYPGDDVVDFIGADVYNGNWRPELSAQQRWNLVRDAPYGLAWHRRFAIARNKPMSFPEWGTGTRPDGHGGGDDPVFMRNMIEWIRANPVAYHGYWDYKAPDYNGRLSDGSQPASEAVFLQAFGVRR